MIWSLIGTLGKYLINSYNKRVDADTEIQLELIKATPQVNAQKVSFMKSLMSQKIFWVVWAMFAIPTATWYAAVMLDTTFNYVNWSVPNLPPAIRPWANQIFNNIFYSGAIVGGVQTFSRGLFGFLSSRR